MKPKFPDHIQLGRIVAFRAGADTKHSSLVGQMGEFYGSLDAMHPAIMAELVRRYNAYDALVAALSNPAITGDFAHAMVATTSLTTD